MNLMSKPTADNHFIFKDHLSRGHNAKKQTHGKTNIDPMYLLKASVSFVLLGLAHDSHI